jgi:hypothetical protein
MGAAPTHAFPIFLGDPMDHVLCPNCGNEFFTASWLTAKCPSCGKFIGEKSKQKLATYSRKAAEAYRKSDESRWVSALFCHKVVGSYERGATLGLASDIGVSVDTVEDLSHAYQLYNELHRMPKAGAFVRMARLMPYIYMAHFRALYEAKERYHLDNEKILRLLLDIFMGEGQISSRDVDQHARDRYGDTRTWEYYGAKATKAIATLLNQPDMPTDGRKIVQDAFEWLGEHA